MRLMPTSEVSARPGQDQADMSGAEILFGHVTGVRWIRIPGRRRQRRAELRAVRRPVNRTSCADHQALLMDQLLASGSYPGFAAHAAACEQCCRDARDLRAVWESFRDLPVIEVPYALKVLTLELLRAVIERENLA